MGREIIPGISLLTLHQSGRRKKDPTGVQRVQGVFCYIDAYEDVSQELKELRELFYFIDTDEERKTLQEFREFKEFLLHRRV